MPDGRLGLLDFGQTQKLRDEYRLWLCWLVLAMAASDYEEIGRLIRTRGAETGQFRMQNPTNEALAAIAYTYFDTRWTPLAHINVFDLNNSPLMENKIERNTTEGSMVVRVVFLVRGMMSSCGVESSMVQAWEPYARQALEAAGESPPSKHNVAFRRQVSQVKMYWQAFRGEKHVLEMGKARKKYLEGPRQIEDFAS